VGLNYFQVMGTRIFAGRDFVPLDLETNTRAVIVNRAFARRYWPIENPIGQVFRIGDSIQAATAIVVGVAQDGPINQIGEEPEPYMYLPFPKGYLGELAVLLETAGDPTALAGSFRETIRAIDKSITPYLMSSLKEVVRQGLYDREVMATFMGSFGLLGLVLASFGLYGIVSYAVSQRTREIGLRMALGARQRDALIMVLKQGLLLSLLGMALGIPLSFATSYFLRSALYQVSPADPSALAGTALLLVSVALLASYLPARRAARVDPMIALRHQ
jgi:putative ABC transport system permease protein